MEMYGKEGVGGVGLHNGWPRPSVKAEDNSYTGNEWSALSIGYSEEIGSEPGPGEGSLSETAESRSRKEQGSISGGGSEGIEVLRVSGLQLNDKSTHYNGLGGR